jgi:hypothetical protein
MRENSLDKQGCQSPQLELCCNENAIAMLSLSSQGSPEMMTHEADFYISAKKAQGKEGMQKNQSSQMMARTGSSRQGGDEALGET